MTNKKKNHYIYHCSPYVNGNFPGFLIHRSDWFAVTFCNDDQFYNIARYGFQINRNRWHKVVYYQASNEMKITIDGKTVQTQASSTPRAYEDVDFYASPSKKYGHLPPASGKVKNLKVCDL